MMTVGENTSSSQLVASEHTVPHPGSTVYRRYVLGILTLVLTVSFFDRGLIVLLLQPIKEDLRLSDTELGFMTGFAFAMFYATLGLPMARLADRGNRVTLASAAIALWSLTVMSCQLVVTFPQLLLARVAAAVGEAGCMPPTYSLVGDYFKSPAERSRAMAVYWLASPLSQLISFTAASALNQRFGWRNTFLIMGIPALLLAILIKLTVTEPRGRASRLQKEGMQLPRMSHVLSLLWHQRSTRHLSAAIVLTLTLSLGLYPWYASFMVRSHGMSVTDIGIWFGLIFGISGVAGISLGGWAVSRWYADDERSQLRLIAIVTAFLLPCFAIFLLFPLRYQALLSLAPLLVIFNFFMGPTFALLQRLMPEETRATTLAVIMLLSNLIGMGIGAQVVGVLSDLLQPALGVNSLRYAMLLMSCLAIWAAFHFWQAGQAVADDLRCPP